jgi:phage tail sheath protein FI
MVYDYAMVENSVSPIVAINLFDPWVMSHPVTLANLQIVNSTIAVTGEVILPSLIVTGQSGKTYAINVDYSFTYNDTTLKSGTIAVFNTSTLATETSVTVAFYTPDLTQITPAVVVGGVTTGGQNTGLACLQDVYNNTNIVVCNVICPGFGWNTTVAAAANAAVQNLNGGRFRADFIASADCSKVTRYSALGSWISQNNFTSAFEFLTWPNIALGGKSYYGEVALAVVMAQTDATLGSNIPYVSPDNKSVTMDSTILYAGKPILINDSQAVAIDNLGCVTFINDRGWYTLGGYTCAFPEDTDVKDFWINERRMFNWLGCTMSLNLKQFIGQPGNLRTLTTIENTIQAFLNTLVQLGAVWNARVAFNPDENPATKVMAGIYTYHILWTPVTEIRTLNLLLEFDVAGLTAAITSVTLVSSS